jgi:hypothetical protein
VPVAPNLKDSASWYLFWAALGDAQWHKLEGHKHVHMAESRGACTLKLSISLICEVVAAANAEEGRSNEELHRFYQLAHGSGMLSAWRVAES